MKTYGLIGYPLDHSFSARYFAEKFQRESITDARYQLFPLEDIQDLRPLVREHAVQGLNVTIPHKIAVMPLLDELDASAAAVGAVNCIRIRHDQERMHLTGFNTDQTGFRQSLLPLLQPWHIAALVLGNGGAALAVQYVLRQMNIRVHTVTRRPSTGSIGYADLTNELMEQCLLIVQTTPLGTHPHTEACPDIPYQALGGRHLLYDLVYNPHESLFLRKGKAQGAVIKNGLEMLRIQAEESWRIWNSTIR